MLDVRVLVIYDTVKKDRNKSRWMWINYFTFFPFMMSKPSRVSLRHLRDILNPPVSLQPAIKPSVCKPCIYHSHHLQGLERLDSQLLLNNLPNSPAASSSFNRCSKNPFKSAQNASVVNASIPVALTSSFSSTSSG